MTEVKHVHDVGAPDPELNTSPIAEENDDESEVLRQEMPGEPVCYFNNQTRICIFADMPSPGMLFISAIPPASSVRLTILSSPIPDLFILEIFS